MTPSPSYSGERVGVRGGTSVDLNFGRVFERSALHSKLASKQRQLTLRPSPLRSCPSTRERGAHFPLLAFTENLLVHLPRVRIRCLGVSHLFRLVELPLLA